MIVDPTRTSVNSDDDPGLCLQIVRNAIAHFFDNEPTSIDFYRLVFKSNQGTARFTLKGFDPFLADVLEALKGEF